MKALIQRVSQASVKIDNKINGKIEKGFLILLGVGESDTDKSVTYLCEKILNLRVFEDENNKMNNSLLEINGEILIISQFTLFADCKKGRRPNFMKAAKPEKAKELYFKFIERCKKYNIKVETGIFGADMDVNLNNDGPVTIMLDTDEIMK